MQQELTSNSSQIIVEIAKSGPNLIRMLLSLSKTYLTLGYQVRKTRNAFERQLVFHGMSEHDAESVSACFEELKDNIVAAIKRGVHIGL